MIYDFPVYWTQKQKVDFLQRVILAHSYLYYALDSPVWSDKKYDECCKQLVSEQTKMNKSVLKNETQYGYVFFDFDGTTGFDLCGRLKKDDLETIKKITNIMK